MTPFGRLITVLLISSTCLYHVQAAAFRERRSLWELNTLINCFTGRSGLLYNGYGCWCGFGGSGRPVDGIDRCCMEHDNCYGRLQSEDCGVYFLNYGYTKRDCGQRNVKAVSCTDNIGCGRELCECDKQLAKCLLINVDSYNKAFANFEKSFCDVQRGGLVINDIVESNSPISVVSGDEAASYRIDDGTGIYQQI
ncbi:basic phospholipase A2 homolog LmutTX-like [Diadema antillarum]|uniref:basic phospholipase A2 homolog LmutTX-like n=1 Tax=Diadema antillarum TaxID=105358 RepID=UPI003A83A6EC